MFDCILSRRLLTYEIQGTLVEVEKRDILCHAQLDMSPFALNRTFSCIHANVMMKNLPKTERALARIVNLYEEGHIQPIRPVTSFDAAAVEDSYRYMQQGQHVGKIVINFPKQDGYSLPLTRVLPDPSFRRDSSYLLMGGTGG